MGETKTERKPVMWWREFDKGWAIGSGIFSGYIVCSHGLCKYGVEKGEVMIVSGLRSCLDSAKIAVEDAILQEIAEQSTRVDGCEEVKG